MPDIDLAAYAPLMLILLLAVLTAVVVHMRDPASSPPHPVSRRVWCDVYRRVVTVEFTERVETGIALRAVRRCPLRPAGSRCGEACRWESIPSDTGLKRRDPV
jgi:hypothetical protein